MLHRFVLYVFGRSPSCLPCASCPSPGNEECSPALSLQQSHLRGSLPSPFSSVQVAAGSESKSLNLELLLWINATC